jgi:aspartyl-tRNA(Asn)/glutamyl-tRNA(Gln) amidotransferase subunit A
VRDCAILLQVMAGFDPLDPTSQDWPSQEFLDAIEKPVEGQRIAVATGRYFDTCDHEVRESVERAAGVFSGLGARVAEVELPYLRDAAAANLVITQADAATFHGQALREHAELLGEDVRERLEMGAAYSASEYARARRTQVEVRRDLELFFGDYDCLVLPTTPIPAPLIEGAGAVESARTLTRFTAPFNLTGLPALSIPCGFNKDGLPIGLQIVSGPWAENLVLQAGHAFEAATTWNERLPSILQ